MNFEQHQPVPRRNKTIRLGEETWGLVERESERLGISQRSFIEEILLEYFKKAENTP